MELQPENFNLHDNTTVLLNLGEIHLHAAQYGNIG